MSRLQLEDRICYCQRELESLQTMKTNCLSCGNKKYNKNECLKYGVIPVEFLLRDDCPDWQFELIPF